jgi:hypothetical protein
VGDYPFDPDDLDDVEHDDLAALDFSVAGDDADDAGLDVFGEYVTDEGDEGDAHLEVADTLAPVDDELPVPLFTVTNPPGTVTVTALLDGRVQHIDLSAKVTTMTETDLAEEIVIVAGLATQDAKSAQYAFMLEGMRKQGHDDVATRDFLTRDLDLPTPEETEAARAQVFSTRYAVDHD